jgi:DNA-binding LacI/PurR family transcriptional regulator
MATIFDVARRAGVSITTVSHVFSGKRTIAAGTRERVLRAARELDYAPNRTGQALAMRRAFTVAILLPNPLDLCLINPAFSELVLTITEACSLVGYGVLVFGVDAGTVSGDLRAALKQRQVDGVIWIDPPAEEDDVVRFFEVGAVPVVVGGTPVHADRTVHVRNDRHQVASLALRHLRDLGHRHVGLVIGPRHLMVVRDYVAAFRDVAAKCSDELRVEPIYTPGWTIKDGRDAVTEFLVLRAIPSAVIAANEPLAVGVVQAGREQGSRVPHELAVVSIGNAHLAAHFSPGISAIDVHTRDTGLALVRRLLDLIDGKPMGDPLTIVPATLFVRESTDPAKIVCI